jgi:hypothetical protein
MDHCTGGDDRGAGQCGAPPHSGFERTDPARAFASAVGARHQSLPTGGLLRVAHMF